MPLAERWCSRKACNGVSQGGKRQVAICLIVKAFPPLPRVLFFWILFCVFLDVLGWRWEGRVQECWSVIVTPRACFLSQSELPAEGMEVFFDKWFPFLFLWRIVLEWVLFRLAPEGHLIRRQWAFAPEVGVCVCFWSSDLIYWKVIWLCIGRHSSCQSSAWTPCTIVCAPCHGSAWKAST